MQLDLGGPRAIGRSACMSSCPMESRLPGYRFNLNLAMAQLRPTLRRSSEKPMSLFSHRPQAATRIALDFAKGRPSREVAVIAAKDGAEISSP